MFIMAWSVWQLQKVTRFDFSFPQHRRKRNDFTSFNCLNTKAKFSACLPAGLWAWAEGTNLLFWSSFSFLLRFQILSALWNRQAPIRHTCDWSLWSAPANDNWRVIDAFHVVLRRCIRSCLKDRRATRVRMQRTKWPEQTKTASEVELHPPTHTCCLWSRQDQILLAFFRDLIDINDILATRKQVRDVDRSGCAWKI